MTTPPRPMGPRGRRPRVLFVCGSINQTTQMHQVARELPEHEHAFTPYYCDGPLEWARRTGIAEFTVAGERLVRRCLDYLERERLPVDHRGERGPYDLVVSCCREVLAERPARPLPGFAFPEAEAS